MQEQLKQYHLNKFNQSKIHFDIKDAEEYLSQHKDRATRPHRHSYYQLIWFKTAGVHYIDYEVIRHPAHTIIIINKNQVHYFCPDSANQGYLFHFNDIFLSQYDVNLMYRLTVSVFSEMLPNTCVLDADELTLHEQSTRHILKEFEEQKHFFGEMIFHLLTTILIRLERKLEKSSAISIHSDDFLLAYQFKKLITENIHQFWSLDEFAEKLSTNKKTLQRATQQILFETSAKLIIQLKILEAKRMLASPGLSIKEVAYRLGFEQATYFTKYFKKETGLTPKEFRATIL